LRAILARFLARIAHARTFPSIDHHVAINAMAYFAGYLLRRALRIHFVFVAGIGVDARKFHAAFMADAALAGGRAFDLRLELIDLALARLPRGWR
jgi:hypothetical protein